MYRLFYIGLKIDNKNMEKYLCTLYITLKIIFTTITNDVKPFLYITDSLTLMRVYYIYNKL